MQVIEFLHVIQLNPFARVLFIHTNRGENHGIFYMGKETELAFGWFSNCENTLNYT